MTDDTKDALEGRIADLEAELATLREENTKLTDSKDEVEHIAEARIRALEDKLLNSELVAMGVPDEHMEVCAFIKRERPEAFEQTVAAFVTQTVQEPIGLPGVAATGAQASVEDLVKQAQAAGYVPGKNLAVWLAKNHPERMDEVLSALRD